MRPVAKIVRPKIGALALSLALLVALLIAAVPAQAKIMTVTGGSFQPIFTANQARAFTAHQFKVTSRAPAVGDWNPNAQSLFRMPWSTSAGVSTWDWTNKAGTINYGGGLRFINQANDKRVSFWNFRVVATSKTAIQVYAVVLSSVPSPKTLPGSDPTDIVFNVTNGGSAKWTLKGKQTEADGLKLALTPAGASVLNSHLTTTYFSAGQVICTADMFINTK